MCASVFVCVCVSFFGFSQLFVFLALLNAAVMTLYSRPTIARRPDYTNHRVVFVEGFPLGARLVTVIDVHE